MLSERRRGWLRGLCILAVVGLWLAVGAFGGQAQGRLSSVQTNDSSAFLPSSAESTRAAERAAAFVDAESLPALLVAVPADGGTVTPAQLDVLDALAEDLPDVALAGTGPGDPSRVGDLLVAAPVVVPAEDGEAALVVLPVDAERASDLVGDDERANDVVVQAVRDATAAQLAGTGLDAWVTGPAGFVADLASAFGGIDTVLLLVALGAVLVILAVVYRSPFLPLVVIVTALLALCLAGLVVYLLADAGALTLNGQAQGILSILVVGASVDYALLVVARYREELTRVASTYAALRRAVRASLGPVAASAGTVAAGLLCLVLSDLSSNRSLGPVAAIGVAAAFCGALTFLPAVLVVAGERSRVLFWPRRPHHDAARDPDHGAPEGHRAWSRVAASVARRDRRVWVSTALVLAGCAAFVPTLDAEGTGESEVFLTQVDSVVGEEVLAEHFAGVSAQPATVVVPAADLDAVLDVAGDVEGVAAARPVTAGAAATAGAPGRGADGAASGPPLVVDGRSRVDVTTTAPSDSRAAVDTVERLRAAVHDVSPGSLVGGAAAERLDTRLAGERDLRVIVPVVLVVVLLVLVVLLRAVPAALLLVAANVLSFGAALGVSALVFEHVLSFPGADPAVPLYAFCFLVALGVDYSIFLASRVREETAAHGARAGVTRGLTVTGSVITSAGVVLAATFAALGVIPLLFLAQLAFIVSFGVLLDALVVRSLLVPALLHDAGRRVWWPSRLARAPG